MKLKRTIGFLLCLVMLLGLLPMGVFAVGAGDVAAPDSAAWGTQGNNGWYYMYKLADGTYHEMNFYGSTDEVSWRQNAYASDLSTTVEMFFINQSSCFYGENGTRPVYAYKAPATGRIVLTTLTHSTEQMKMQAYVGDKLQKISGKDELTLCTTGIFDGAMTKTELILDVSKDEMVYVEFYSSDMNAQRQAWIGGYEVEYLSVKESVDYTGQTLSPDMNAWGTQGNNGWYYMYKLADGAIHEMPFYTAEDSVAWRQNAYASDLSTTVEMFFINQASFFTGENGTRPVYAFKAPVGGQIKLYFETHGVEEMFAQVYVGDKLQTINGSDRVTFTTTGTLPGAMTATELTMNVKKDETLYIVCGTSGTNREGWLQNYQVTYLSTNDEVDYTGVSYAAASSNWGKQDNNGWFYMYDFRGTGKYGLLDYYPTDAAIAWQQNAYSFDVNRYVEMLFVQETHFFTGEQGSKVVYGFKAPASGTLDVYFETHGNENITAQAFVEDTLVQINGADTLVFSAGSLEGAFAPNTMTVNMTKGEMLYIVCSSAIRDGWFRNPSATYTHACASNVTETEAVAPTCTTEGNVSYFTCTCGKVYADAACTTEITDTVLPALGHNYADGSCTLCGQASHVTIYFQNNWLWSDICLYYWYADGSWDYAWPGASMELYGNDGTYDVYVSKIPVEATGFIINGVKNDGSDTRDQTPDITSGWYEGICYYMLWSDGNTTGSEPIDVIIPPVCNHNYGYVNNGDDHTATCTLCGDIITEGHTYENGSCICGATEVVAPTEVTVKVSHTVSFDSDLQMNYRIKLSDILAAVPNYVTDGAYLVVEKDRYPMGGGEKTVETVTLQPDLTTDETRMLFSLPGIQSVEMGSELRAVLHFFDADGKEYYTAVDTYSVLAYAQLCFDYYDPTTDATLFTMLIDCLNYGAAAQVAFDRRADEPVNAGLDAYQQYATTELSAELTDVKTVAENDRSITAVSKMGFSVTFADKTELNAKLTIAEGYTKSDITSVKVLNEAGEEVATLTEFTELSDGRLQVTFTGVKSVDMRNMYYFVAYVGDQVASQNVGYSIEAYAKSNVASNDVNAANLARTCIYYGDSAYAHFNRNNQNKTAWIATIPGDTDANGWSAPIA